MILNSKCVHHSPSRTISCPINSELAPPPQSLSSPPDPSSRVYKHSLSKPTTWLNRSSSSTSSYSAPYAAPQPTRISEPKIGSSLGQFNFRRSGPLGSGATIVRTPQEALSGSHYACESIGKEEGIRGDILIHNAEKNGSRLPALPPPSPPLPSLPDISDGGTSTSIRLSNHEVPRSCPSGPTSSQIPFFSSKPTLVTHSRAPSRSIPTPPTDIDISPPQPPFDAILLSSVPDGAIDPSKLIVTLETCTITYRTSLRSLISRPSHLSHYITSLLPTVSETASMYSNSSEVSLVQPSSGFSSAFLNHASSGCLPRSSPSIHIFLDRSSAPYAHILTYLRSPPGTLERPEAIPRAVQLGAGSIHPSRVEALFELRDEASYLGLAELEKLCCHELNRFHCGFTPVSVAVHGGSVPRDKTGSIHSFHTVVEEWECQGARLTEHRALGIDSGADITESSARKSSSELSCESKDVPVKERGKGRKGIKYEMGPPPPGWI